jgi:hypothetical protein
VAVLLNPNSGLPGAPRVLNWWAGPQFNISDLLATLPPPMPPAPTTPASTPQDQAAQDNALSLGGRVDDTAAGGGSTGTPTGGVAPSAASGGTLNTAPANFSSNFGPIAGTIGSIAGMAAGVPGLGTGLGLAGSMLDLSRYSDNLRSHGIAIDPNYASAALASVTGLPFGLGSLFGTSARQQAENARRDALANGIFGTDPFGIGASSSWNADLANAATPAQGLISGDLPYGAPVTGTAAQYPAGFLDWSSGLASQDTQGQADKAAAQAAGDYGSIGGKDASYGGLGQGYDSGGNYGGSMDKGGGDRNDPGALYSRGGVVRGPGLIPGFNPPGPDNTTGALLTGEGVLTRGAMQRYPGLLSAANAGKLDPAKVKGLLTAGARR